VKVAPCPSSLAAVKVPLAFLGKDPAGDRLPAEELDGAVHRTDLVTAAGADFLVRVPFGQTGPPGRKRIQPPDQVAADVEPQDGQRKNRRRQRGNGVGPLRRRGRLLGRLARHHGPCLDPVGQGRGRRFKFQRRVLEKRRSLWRSGWPRADDPQQVRYPFGPARVPDRGQPARDHLDPGVKIVAQGLQVGLGRHTGDAAQQQPDLGGRGPGFERQSHLEQVDLDRLVRRPEPFLRTGGEVPVHRASA
jgi:hypothetical protein